LQVTVGYKKRLPIRPENLATVFYTVLPTGATLNA